MNSHEVELVEKSDKEFAKCSSHDDWHYFTATVKGQDRCFRIKRLDETKTSAKTKTDEENVKCYQEKASQPWNDTPFWVIGVTSKLIPNHTDIFQGGTLQLLITIANHYELEPPKAVPPPADQCDVRPDCTPGQLRGH